MAWRLAVWAAKAEDFIAVQTSLYSWQIYVYKHVHDDIATYFNYTPNIIYRTEEAALKKVKELCQRNQK